jgi:hypothetical protein
MICLTRLLPELGPSSKISYESAQISANDDRSNQYGEIMMKTLIATAVVVLCVLESVSANNSKCSLDGTSIHIYVSWTLERGHYRSFKWNTEGLKEIENAPADYDYRWRTNVVASKRDERSSVLPQELFAPEKRLDVPFAISRDGRMAVSCVHPRANTMSPCKHLSIVNLKERKLLCLIEASYYVNSIAWSPTASHFAVLFKEDVTAKVWKGPVDWLAVLVGHPRSYHTFHVAVYNLDGKIICEKVIMKNLLFGNGYIEWE